MVFDYRSVLHHFRGGNTHAHRRGPIAMTGLLPTRNTLPLTHAQQQHRHRTPFRDIKHILTTAKFTWHWSVWSDPRKAARTHKRAGTFVFVECHTSSRGKRVTGPGRPLKPEGGVCGNRLCGYLWCQLQYWDCGLFPGLGLCLSDERETIPGLYIRA